LEILEEVPKVIIMEVILEVVEVVERELQVCQDHKMVKVV
jgi:hypothetical protein